jgi:outer membrane murein-binding lipoprotein Lpp
MNLGRESKGMGMTERQERLALEREEIAARVANFKATQEKFQREREEYYAATMEAARAVRWNKFAGGTLHR